MHEAHPSDKLAGSSGGHPAVGRRVVPTNDR